MEHLRQPDCHRNPSLLEASNVPGAYEISTQISMASLVPAWKSPDFGQPQSLNAIQNLPCFAVPCAKPFPIRSFLRFPFGQGGNSQSSKSLDHSPPGAAGAVASMWPLPAGTWVMSNHWLSLEDELIWIYDLCIRTIKMMWTIWTI